MHRPGNGIGARAANRATDPNRVFDQEWEQGGLALKGGRAGGYGGVGRNVCVFRRRRLRGIGRAADIGRLRLARALDDEGPAGQPRKARGLGVARNGGASCRERVCQDVWISVIAVAVKKKWRI